MNNLNIPVTIKETDLYSVSPNEITTWLHQIISLTIYGRKSTNIVQAFLGKKEGTFPRTFHRPG